MNSTAVTINPLQHHNPAVVEGVEVRFYRVPDSRSEMLRAEAPVADGPKDWVIIPYPQHLSEAAAYLVAARTLRAKQAACQAAAQPLASKQP